MQLIVMIFEELDDKSPTISSVAAKKLERCQARPGWGNCPNCIYPEHLGLREYIENI